MYWAIECGGGDDISSWDCWWWGFSRAGGRTNFRYVGCLLIWCSNNFFGLLQSSYLCSNEFLHSPSIIQPASINSQMQIYVKLFALTLQILCFSTLSHRSYSHGAIGGDGDVPRICGFCSGCHIRLRGRFRSVRDYTYGVPLGTIWYLGARRPGDRFVAGVVFEHFLTNYPFFPDAFAL